MVKHQKQLVNRPSLSMFVGDAQGLPKDLLTMSEMRDLLLSSNTASSSMMYWRAHSIFLMQLRSILQRENGTQRAYAFSMYLLGTAYPLAMTNANSDTGQYGGMDPRVAVFTKLGEAAFPGSRFQSSLAQGFAEGARAVRGELTDGKWYLDAHPGTLMSSLLLVNASLAYSNRNWRLKANNIELMFRSIISDIGMNLCFLNYALQMAPNGIGFINWIKNLQGCILSDARRVDTPYEETVQKGRGCGADKTMGEFTNSQHSSSYRQPNGVDITPIPTIVDCKGFTNAAFWHLFTEMVDKNGKVLSRPQTNPATVYCTDITPFNPSQAASGAVNQHEKICQLTPRNTLAPSAGKRTTTVRNERTQNFDSVDQVLVFFWRCIALAQNLRTGNPFEQTLKVICTSVAAGAVDVAPLRRGGAMDAEADGRHDMGEEGKYTSQNIVPHIKKTTRLLNHDAVGVALVVADAQNRGYYGHIQSLVEAAVFGVVANLVRVHVAYMLPDAASHAEWGRHVQKVEARMPPTGLLMHAMHTLEHRAVHAMSFSDIVHRTAVNFIANPCPMETLPVYAATLINNTFDWGFWLMLGLFAELFEIPALPVEEVERLYGESDYCTSEEVSAPLRAWLSAYGFDDGAATPERVGDVMYGAYSTSPMARSAVYITTNTAADAALTGDDLACVLGSDKSAGGGGGGGGGVWGASGSAPVSRERKVAKNIAKLVFDKYENHLSAACNVTTEDAVEIMLARYMNKPMHFPKFGKVPASQGVDSVDSLLERLGHGSVSAGNAGMMDQSNYVDGASAEARKCKFSTGGGHSYRVAPWACVNAGGNVWRFGVELRFLILARSVFGTSHGVSQTSVQKVFDHMTKQILLERIPPSIFPYSAYVTSMPDADGLALSISTIDSHATRPSTMVRALPTSAIVDRNASAIPGVLPCMHMPEDVNIVAAQWRLAERLSDPKLTVSHRDVHIEELVTPCIPLDTWVSVDVVLRPATADTHDFSAASAEYQPAALYIHAKTQRVTWVVRREHIDPVQLEKRTTSFGLSGAIGGDAAGSDAWHKDFERSSFLGVQQALAATARAYVRFVPIFLRHGVLVEVPMLGDLTHYMVLQPWADADVKGIEPPLRPDSVWYNPSTMGYLAGSEYAPDDEEYSYRLWPTLADVKPLRPGDNGDDPVRRPWAARRINLEAFAKRTLNFELDYSGDADANIEIFEDLYLQQLCAYTCDDNQYANISSLHVEQHMVRTGSHVIVDAMHPVMRKLALAPGVMRFSHTCAPDGTADGGAAIAKKGTSLEDVTALEAAADVHPVLHAMLLYELPESIALRSHGLEEYEVWVGIRLLDESSKHVTAHYMAVPSRALIPPSRLEGLGYMQAVFDLYHCKPTT